MRFKRILLGIIALLAVGQMSAAVPSAMPRIEDRRLAICLGAPSTKSVDRFCRFITERLAKDGFQTLVVLTRYRYAFNSHPECRGADPLSREDIKKIVRACREVGIELIPKMNLLGHQDKSPAGLLKGHPDMDEAEGRDKIARNYHRSICPLHPDAAKLVCDLMDEMVEAFEAKSIHIGCDEVFEIGMCKRCKGKPTAKLYADWVNTLRRHNAGRGVSTLMWGDRMLDSKRVNNTWEGSANGTAASINMVDKEMIVCDWHYENCKAYPSVDELTKAGFKYWVCPWRYCKNAKKFLAYANAHDKGNAIGLMLTTWCGFDQFADAVEGKVFKEDKKRTLDSLAETYRTFRKPKVKYRLLWSDEFNGTKLDETRWNRCDKGPSDWNRHMSARADLAELKDGALVLWGKANTDTNADVRPFLTGGVTSRGKGTFGLGKVEMRVKFENHQQGAWPALWLMPNQVDAKGRGWPWGGEIDVVERLNGDSFVYHTVHSGWTLRKKHDQEPPHGGKAPIRQGDWNVYALEVQPEALIWSVNGKETLRYVKTNCGDADQWPFGTPFYVLMDMQLGGSWVGKVNVSTLPVRMFIDWIRVYEKE